MGTGTIAQILHCTWLKFWPWIYSACDEAAAGTPLDQLGFIAQTAIPLVGLVFAALWTWSKFLGARHSERIVVRRITQSTDPDLLTFLDLHNDFFAGRLGDDIDDLKVWISQLENSSDPEWDEIYLLAKEGKSPRGYLFASFHVPTRRLFIDNLGVIEEKFVDRRPVTRKILAKLNRYVRVIRIRNIWSLKYLTSPKRIFISAAASLRDTIDLISNPHRHYCKYILSEIDLEEEHKSKSKAKLLGVRFAWVASSVGLNTYYLSGIDYEQPIIDVEDQRVSHFLSGGELIFDGRQALLYVPVEKIHPSNLQHISKDQCLDILDFLLMEVYGDQYSHDNEKNRKYRIYLSAAMNMYSSILPEIVAVKRI